MKHFIFTFFIVALVCSAASAKTYFNDDIPANAGSFTKQSINTRNSGWYDGKEYQSISGTRYSSSDRVNIYGSDGSHYTRLGNTIKSNSGGQSYQINGNIIKPLY